MTTTYLPAPPPPNYQRPLTLREALDRGVDLNEVTILDELGRVLAGDDLTGDQDRWRFMVAAALEGDTRCCVPFKSSECGEGEYQWTWPRQESLENFQWIADLIDEPELAPLVLERLNDENRAYVEEGVRQHQEMDAWWATMQAITDDRLIEAATDLAAWLTAEAAATPGREMFTAFGHELFEAVEGGHVDRLRSWFSAADVR